MEAWTFFRGVCLFICLFTLPKPGFSTTPTQEQWNQALRSAVEILAKQYSIFSTVGFESYESLTDNQILEKLAIQSSSDAGFLFPLGKISEIQVQAPTQRGQKVQDDAFRRVQWMVSFNVHARSLNIGKSHVKVALFRPDDHQPFKGMVTKNQWILREPKQKNSHAQMLFGLQQTIMSSLNSRNSSSQTSRSLDQLAEIGKLNAIDLFFQLKISDSPLAQLSNRDLPKQLGFIGEPYLFWKTTAGQLGSGLLSESQLQLNEIDGIVLFIVLEFQQKRHRFSVRFERQEGKLIPSTGESTIFYPDSLLMAENIFGNSYRIQNRKIVTAGKCPLTFTAK